METITFYSYKGGVGRTLALANVAYYLALLGQKVVAVDFDLEAPGLHYKLSPKTLGNQSDDPLPGVVDFIKSRIEGSNIPLAELVQRVETSRSLTGSISMIAAGAAPSPAYWQKLSSIDWSHQIDRFLTIRF